MPQFSDPRDFLPVIAIIPIMLIVTNQTVATSLLNTAETMSFQIWLALIGSYLIIRKGNYITKIKWVLIQEILEISLLGLPFVYPIYLIATEANPIEFEGVFLAYITFALLTSIYMLLARKSLGGGGKIGAFLFAYIFALMIYAGAVAGQQIGVPFLVTVAIDQLFRVAIITGYPAYVVLPPAEIYIRASMTLAIPVMIFLSLSSELAKSNAKETAQKSGVNLISDLRPAILLLTFAAVLALALTLPLSLWLVTSNRQLITIIPALSIAAIVMLIILISEGRENKIR